MIFVLVTKTKITKMVCRSECSFDSIYDIIPSLRLMAENIDVVEMNDDNAVNDATAIHNKDELYAVMELFVFTKKEDILQDISTYIENNITTLDLAEITDYAIELCNINLIIEIYDLIMSNSYLSADFKKDLQHQVREKCQIMRNQDVQRIIDSVR